MANLVRTVKLSASADEVWARIGPFGGLADWHPAIDSCTQEGQGVGAVRTLRIMIPAVIMGTYFSLILWMAGMKYADVSIAAALNQTSLLFTFVLAAIFLREPVTGLRIFGLLLGLGGVALVTFGGAG